MLLTKNKKKTQKNTKPMPIGSLLKMQFPWPFNLQDPIFKSGSKEFRILNEIPKWFSYKTSVRDWIVYPPNSFIEIFTPKWQPTPVFLLENPMVRGAWQAIVLGAARIGHDLATKPTNQTEDDCM